MLPATEEIEGGDLDLPQLRTGLEPAPGTRPEYPPLADHYRIDINSGRPPAIDGATWRLKVRGLVAAEKEFTLDDLKNNFTAYDEFITIGCISNRVGGSLIGTTRWTGLRFQDFLAEVGVLPEAAFVHIYGADGFDEVVSLADIRADERILLAYEWDGVPLPQKHGFPLRVYLPDLYGMKQPKWITEMEFIPEWREGYWVRRNWSAIARVNATSVVDTVAVEAVYEQDGQRILPVGGIAWAGARGISSVEVRVDDGEWQAAQLRTPLSPLTWVIWRFDWPAQDGRHTFTVRCIEGDGTTRQIETPRGPRPDGATGLHRKTDTL
jgi:DMSO/TMAO reductase YedYZ molybdopterin-dependent catalytic subunit